MSSAGYIQNLSEKKLTQQMMKATILNDLDVEIQQLLMEMTEDQLFIEEYQYEIKNIIEDTELYYSDLNFDSKDTFDIVLSAILEIDSPDWKMDTILEMKLIIKHFNMDTDLNIILKMPNLSYNGKRITNKEKELIKSYLDALFN